MTSTGHPMPTDEGEGQLLVPCPDPYSVMLVSPRLGLQEEVTVGTCCGQDCLLLGRRYSGWSLCITTLLQDVS